VRAAPGFSLVHVELVDLRSTDTRAAQVLLIPSELDL